MVGRADTLAGKRPFGTFLVIALSTSILNFLVELLLAYLLGSPFDLGERVLKSCLFGPSLTFSFYLTSKVLAQLGRNQPSKR